jgi:type II secretion system protein H
MRIRPHRRSGFTLVEIIIVVMIMGLIMAWGMPTFVQTFKRKPLQQAVNDFMEGCASARASAIMTGAPAELVVGAGDDNTTTFRVQSGASSTLDPLTGQTTGGGSTTFNEKLPEGIAFEMLAVNFQDAVQAGQSEVRVRFFPNGTCDEFTAVMLEPASGKRRMIHLDVITGHADLKTEDQIAQMKK